MTVPDPRTAEERLPPGPYHLEWPDHQGGLFRVWGRQGTPPDFTDGWAIPLVAMGPQGPMEWLLAALAAEPVPAPREPLCGVVSNSGPNGEPLACAYPSRHEGDHSWATLPTFTAGDGAPEARTAEWLIRRHLAAADPVPAPLARRRVSLTPACQADVRCYLSDGHYGEHMYPATPPEPEP